MKISSRVFVIAVVTVMACCFMAGSTFAADLEKKL